MAWCQWALEATSLQDGKAAELLGEMLEVGAGQGWGGQPSVPSLGLCFLLAVLGPSVAPSPAPSIHHSLSV